jgi:DNA-binding response OmpR family regulator
MRKILLVDDELAITELLESLLSKDGYQLLSVNDSQETLSVASVFSPDLILLDLMMPVVNGIDICKALRADPKFAKTPILFFTALSDIDNKVAAYEAGATDFISKPFHPVELQLKIKALIGS